jgi:tetratricopeptide (TPR) repeat protein
VKRVDKAAWVAALPRGLIYNALSIAMKPASNHRTRLARFKPEWMIILFGCLSLGSAMAQDAVNHRLIEIQLKQTHYDQVLQLTQQALKQTPRDAKIRFWQALAQEKLGQTDLAMQGYLALTQDFPELPEPHNNLGTLLLKQGDLDGAQLAFQEALRMDAQYTQALENLADVLNLQAKRLYQKALELSPEKLRLTQKINTLFPTSTP